MIDLHAHTLASDGGDRPQELVAAAAAAGVGTLAVTDHDTVAAVAQARAAEAGGVAVLAHPGRLAAAERDRVLAEALAAGIDGLEVWHPQHDPDLRRSLERLADRRGLLATGGPHHHRRHHP